MFLACPKSSVCVRDFASTLIEKLSTVISNYPQSKSAPWSLKLLDDNDTMATSWKMKKKRYSDILHLFTQMLLMGIISGKWPELMIFHQLVL